MSPRFLELWMYWQWLAFPLFWGVAGFALLRRSLSRLGDRLRFLNAPTAFLIGLVSVWMLYATLERDFFDYFYYSKAKAQDAYI